MLECVPNFSEGQNQSIVDQIVSSVKACPVLDVHSDADHNRTVVTFIGEDDKAVQAAYELTSTALELIDINQHEGAHPFMGSVDVIPFIPLKGTKMEAAVSAANTLAELLWKEHALPSYLYGHAARVPERVNLAQVRKQGGAPDVGQGAHPYAGVISIGARDFLIAFNVDLKTSDISIAESIAKNIREKSSGMCGVKAIGLYLESRKIVQVSVNITDCKKTSLKHVFDKIRHWAKEYKVEILESEVVGMLPKEAVFPDMKKYLMLKAFSKKSIIKP